jgi:acyl dehydratase
VNSSVSHSGLDADAAVSFTIDPDDLEKDQLAVGRDAPDKAAEHFGTATAENIRNFARSYGDDNPLYCDPGYGTRTRWCGQIAPSVMAQNLNTPLTGDAADPALRGGRYRGIHVFAVGFSWEFYEPIRPGDVIYSFACLESVEEKVTDFSGLSVLRVHRRVKINQDAHVVAVHRMTGLYSERKRAKSRAKNAEIAPADYSDVDLEVIDSIYASEARRGPDPLLWESVEVGQTLPPMVKGPLTLTDIIVFHAGGYSLADIRTGRLAYQNRLKKPAFYIKNQFGVPDVAQRVHWDSEWAQATGNPRTIDYGAMREFWLHHYATDWMGDDAWVVRQNVALKHFNYLGDTQFLSGVVVAKREESGRFEVDLHLKATNQIGVETAVASVTLALPTGTNPIVGLPDAPPDLTVRAEEFLARHLELVGGRS